MILVNISAVVLQSSWGEREQSSYLHVDSHEVWFSTVFHRYNALQNFTVSYKSTFFTKRGLHFLYKRCRFDFLAKERKHVVRYKVYVPLIQAGTLVELSCEHMR